MFVKLSSLIAFTCDIERSTTLVFANSTFSPADTVFDKLARDVGIRLGKKAVLRLMNDFRIKYDIECYLTREGLPANTATMEFVDEHKLLSVLACSNVPGFAKHAAS